MAKLYVKVENERGTQKSQLANRHLRIEIFHGSKDDSKLLATVIVIHNENKDRPDLTVFA